MAPFVVVPSLPVDLVRHLPRWTGPKLDSNVPCIGCFQPVHDKEPCLEDSLPEVRVLGEKLRREQQRHRCLTSLQREVDDLLRPVECSELVDGTEHWGDCTAPGDDPEALRTGLLQMLDEDPAHEVHVLGGCGCREADVDDGRPGEGILPVEDALGRKERSEGTLEEGAEAVLERDDPRLPGVLQGAVEVVEVLQGELMELDLPDPGTDGPVHLGAVVPDSRRREVEAFALLKPAIQELADRDPDPVRASPGC